MTKLRKGETPLQARERADDRITAARLRAAGWVKMYPHHWGILARKKGPTQTFWINPTTGVFSIEAFETFVVRTVTGWDDLAELVRVLKGEK